MFAHTPVIRGPITYTGHEALALDIADMKAALAAAGLRGRLPQLGRPGELRAPAR